MCAPTFGACAVCACAVQGISSYMLVDIPDGMEEFDGSSVYNTAEAAAVRQAAKVLHSRGVAPLDIAVISPYAAQVKVLRGLAGLTGEVSTVESFQVRTQGGFYVLVVLLPLAHAPCGVSDRAHSVAHPPFSLSECSPLWVFPATGRREGRGSCDPDPSQRRG
jgi:hypothetical protein